MDKLVAIIPAKGHSDALPRKNMAEQGILFAPDAVAVEQRPPFTVQIDHSSDLNIARALYEYSNSWK